MERKSRAIPPTETIEQQRARYVIPNLDAARIILADPERYGGDRAGLVQWARLVQERAGAEWPPARKSARRQGGVQGRDERVA